MVVGPKLAIFVFKVGSLRACPLVVVLVELTSLFYDMYPPNGCMPCVKENQSDDFSYHMVCTTNLEIKSPQNKHSKKNSENYNIS